MKGCRQAGGRCSTRIRNGHKQKAVLTRFSGISGGNTYFWGHPQCMKLTMIYWQTLVICGLNHSLNENFTRFKRNSGC